MFKQGDLIRIKENFWEIKPTQALGINASMRRMAGQVYEIKCTYNIRKTHYKIIDPYGSNWTWDENWLEFETNIDIDENDWNVMFQS